MATTSLRLQDKVALVTGSSGGIGREIALGLAANGARFVLCADLRAEYVLDAEARPTHDEINARCGQGRAAFIRTDVTIDAPGADGAATMEMAVAEATRMGRGRLDILVNNAGIEKACALHETTLEDWNRITTVNMTGTFLGAKHAIRQFLTQEPDASGERGCIVNVASIAATVGVKNMAPYCASKAAITSLTRVMANEYADRGIRANALCPGYIDTGMLLRASKVPEERAYLEGLVPAGRLGRAQDLLGALVWLASSAEAGYVTGQSVAIDGGAVSR